MAKPKARQPGKSAKAGKTAGQPASSTNSQHPQFCFRYADRATREDWVFKPSPDDAQGILDFTCEMARLTWREIEAMQTGERDRHRKHHSMAVGKIESAAQADLTKRKLGETFGDEIFRFRLGGEKRLWGFRQDRVFHVVFWDPDHKVCPQDR